LATLGTGSFGKVVKVTDAVSNEVRALKITKSLRRFRQEAESEVQILGDLARLDPDNRNRCVQVPILRTSVSALNVFGENYLSIFKRSPGIKNVTMADPRCFLINFTL
jgi:hypothetical protein